LEFDESPGGPHHHRLKLPRRRRVPRCSTISSGFPVHDATSPPPHVQRGLFIELSLRLQLLHPPATPIDPGSPPSASAIAGHTSQSTRSSRDPSSPGQARPHARRLTVVSCERPSILPFEIPAASVAKGAVGRFAYSAVIQPPKTILFLIQRGTLSSTVTPQITRYCPITTASSPSAYGALYSQTQRTQLIRRTPVKAERNPVDGKVQIRSHLIKHQFAPSNDESTGEK